MFYFKFIEKNACHAATDYEQKYSLKALGRLNNILYNDYCIFVQVNPSWSIGVYVVNPFM